MFGKNILVLLLATAIISAVTCTTPAPVWTVGTDAPVIKTLSDGSISTSVTKRYIDAQGFQVTSTEENITAPALTNAHAATATTECAKKYAAACQKVDFKDCDKRDFDRLNIAAKCKTTTPVTIKPVTPRPKCTDLAGFKAGRALCKKESTNAKKEACKKANRVKYPGCWGWNNLEIGSGWTRIVIGGRATGCRRRPVPKPVAPAQTPATEDSRPRTKNPPAVTPAQTPATAPAAQTNKQALITAAKAVLKNAKDAVKALEIKAQTEKKASTTKPKKATQVTLNKLKDAKKAENAAQNALWKLQGYTPRPIDFTTETTITGEYTFGEYDKLTGRWNYWIEKCKTKEQCKTLEDKFKQFNKKVARVHSDWVLFDCPHNTTWDEVSVTVNGEKVPEHLVAQYLALGNNNSYHAY